MHKLEIIHRRLRDYMMVVCKANTALDEIEQTIHIALAFTTTDNQLQHLLNFLAKHSLGYYSMSVLEILNSNSPQATFLDLEQLREDAREIYLTALLESLSDWESALENLDAARVAHMNSGHTTKDACKAAKTIAERRELQARLEMRRAYRVFRDNQLEQVMAVQP